MNAATTNTSIWLALRNPVFRNLWLATVISGVCVAAHNTAAFSVLGTAGESAFLISLMSTLSALPFALFTLPAGAFADMVDRKKILCAVNLWQALIERMTKDEKEVIDKLCSLHVDPNPPGESPRVSMDKEVIKKRV